MSVKLILPFPPSVNNYWRIYRNRMIISKAGRTYRSDVEAAVFADLKGSPPHLQGKLSVVIYAVMPDRRKKRDLDNLFKGALDSMEHAGVYDDDSQIDHLAISRGPVKPPGHLVVTIREYQPRSPGALCAHPLADV